MRRIVQFNLRDGATQIPNAREHINVSGARDQNGLYQQNSSDRRASGYSPQ